jgi:NTP pyrophosphatase (non-canonical NTP hydrolase)
MGPSSADEPTRERVRAAIGQVGGYWRPLAAVARLQEELGELAELFVSSPDIEQSASEPTEQLAFELADLWIITTALADQFLGRVAEPGSYIRRLAPSRDLLVGLAAAAGRVARIVNYYDGPKTPRTFDGWISLGDAIAEFHRALADCAHAHDIDLAAAVAAKLDAIPALDAGRFRAGEHDPSTASSLRRFRAMRAASPRSEAERERLWGSPEWSSKSFVANVNVIAVGLTSFAKAAAWERLDGYLVSGPEFTSIALLDDWLKRLLAELSDRDPVGEAAARTPDGGGARRFAFNGQRLALAVFSPLYEVPDSRHSPDGTFALLSIDRSAAAR